MTIRTVLTTIVVCISLQSTIYFYLNTPSTMYGYSSNAIMSGQQIPCGEIQHDNNNSNNNTTTIFVISLQGVPGAVAANDRRMDRFRYMWNRTCSNNTQSDNFVIEQCPGVLDASTRRGYGLTTAIILCLNRAVEVNQEITMIFEDDARLFDPIYCQSDARIDRFHRVPSDAFVLLLGGHHWQLPDEGNSVHDENDEEKLLYKEVVESFGTYGFAVPRANLKPLRDGYGNYLVRGDRLDQNQTVLSPDVAWFKFARRRRQKVYALNPLLVWHAESYSNTWRVPRRSIRSKYVVDERTVQARNESRDQGTLLNTKASAHATAQTGARTPSIS